MLRVGSMRSILTAANFSMCSRARQKDVEALFINNVEDRCEGEPFIYLLRNLFKHFNPISIWE